MATDLAFGGCGRGHVGAGRRVLLCKDALMADEPIKVIPTPNTLTFYDGGEAQAEVTVKALGDMYQVTFRVAEQSFDIGPRYDDVKMAQGMLSKFCHSLGVFAGIVDQISVAEMPTKVVQSSSEDDGD